MQHGLHKISNLDPETFAVSLHRRSFPQSSVQIRTAYAIQVYAPPNAEKHGCQVFHEKTGVGVHVAKYDLYSEMAVLKEN